MFGILKPLGKGTVRTPSENGELLVTIIASFCHATKSWRMAWMLSKLIGFVGWCDSTTDPYNWLQRSLRCSLKSCILLFPTWSPLQVSRSCWKHCEMWAVLWATYLWRTSFFYIATEVVDCDLAVLVLGERFDLLLQEVAEYDHCVLLLRPWLFVGCCGGGGGSHCKISFTATTMPSTLPWGTPIATSRQVCCSTRVGSRDTGATFYYGGKSVGVDLVTGLGGLDLLAVMLPVAGALLATVFPWCHMNFFFLW